MPEVNLESVEVNEEIKERSKLSKEEWKEYTKTVWHIANVTDEDHPAVFPVEIPKRLIKLFSFVEEIVLDPFAGIGTTAKAAVGENRKAICLEQNKNYVDRMKEDFGLIEEKNGVDVIQHDSRDMAFLDENSIDLIVTSPPYWDKADYGSSEDNVGDIDSYSEFFSTIRPVFEECLRVLRPGRKLCVVTANVNQYTEHGLLTFPLAADFTILLRKLGFVLVSEVIWSKDKTGGQWGSANSQRPIFGSYPHPPNFLFKNVHEYVLVFSKKPDDKRTGDNAEPYRELMDNGLGEQGLD